VDADANADRKIVRPRLVGQGADRSGGGDDRIDG
jgi:hypothetical protein